MKSIEVLNKVIYAVTSFDIFPINAKFRVSATRTSRHTGVGSFLTYLITAFTFFYMYLRFTILISKGNTNIGISTKVQAIDPKN